MNTGHDGGPTEGSVPKNPKVLVVDRVYLRVPSTFFRPSTPGEERGKEGEIERGVEKEGERKGRKEEERREKEKKGQRRLRKEGGGSREERKIETNKW